MLSQYKIVDKQQKCLLYELVKFLIELNATKNFLSHILVGLEIRARAQVKSLYGYVRV